jgi:hypothetical protein
VNNNDQLLHTQNHLTSCCTRVAVKRGDSGGSLLEHQTISSGEGDRILDLEVENARLRKLVAELLVKNEQLRQLYLAASS